MPKLLRPGENVSFLQTRAPAPMWRYVKKVAMDVAADGTVTRLCTDHIVEFLEARRWEKDLQWLRPRAEDGVYKGMATGFAQINLPFSNLDAQGEPILSAAYLQRHGILDLVDRDRYALNAVVEQGETALFLRLVADQLGVSGATFGYTYLDWLSILRFTPGDVPAAKEAAVAATAPASRYAVLSRTKQ